MCRDDAIRGRRRRLSAWVCTLALLLVRPLHADEPLVVSTADEVVAAWDAKDETELAAIAARPSPDPWIVTEELCGRGAFDPATAYAKAATGKAVEKLGDYVRKRRSTGAQAELHEQFRKLTAAFAKKDMPGVVAAADTFGTKLETVLHIRAAYFRGKARAGLGKLDEAASAYLESAAAAAELGWINAATGAYYDGAGVYYQRADWPRALDALRNAYRLFTTLKDQRRMARALSDMALIHESLGDYDDATRVQREALDIVRTLKDKHLEANALSNLGTLSWRQGRYKDALRLQNEALAIWTELGDEDWIAFALERIGLVYRWQGNLTGALKKKQEALSRYEKLGRKDRVTTTLADIGSLQLLLSDMSSALETQELVLDQFRQRKDRAGEARALASIGAVHLGRGDFPKAVMFLTRALKMHEALGDRASMASARINLAKTYVDLGMFAKAMLQFERAIAIADELKDPDALSSALGSLARTRERIGDHEEALRLQKRVLRIKEDIGARGGVAMSLYYLGRLYERMGEPQLAIAQHERALAIAEDTTDVASKMWHRFGLGRAYRALGKHDKSIAALEYAHAKAVEIDELDAAARILGHLGLSRLAAGDRDRAKADLDAAVKAAHSLRTAPIKLDFLGPLARLHLEDGDYGRASSLVTGTAHDMEMMFGGLAEEEGATARERYVELFGVGALAGVRLDEPGTVLEALERARAGTLLESLNGRRGLLWADLPESLRTAEARVKADVVRARHDLDRARRANDLVAARNQRGALDDALAEMRGVSARIQREAKRQAGLFYPRAAGLDRVQRHVPKDTALIVYGFCLEECVALVLRPGDPRVVHLGPAEPVRQACRNLDVQASADTARAGIDKLRELVVDPLKLPAAVRRVLISPDGALCYVPFNALWHGRTVTMTPSATTHVLLREEVWPRGTQILALGDPQYEDMDKAAADLYVRRNQLHRLPNSRAEARFVGTRVLLANEANEGALQKKLSEHKGRWRAVHFACHGLIDAEHPTLSSLALTRSKEDDGFLTCLEILRIEIPSDLAVLSACNSARGRIFRSEGIVGLTRAFMYAGTPRVLCSLWKVDDKATMALMKRFYELWNPDDPATALSAAEALAASQAWIRTQSEWSHPKYWAAWVLWGLPD